jgi:predicted chitinase/8-oxo-dGTP pyrophosphatase MutT (NUDIX family)
MKVNEIIKEDDTEHRDALQKTGFWGKQGAGCLFLAHDTGRICIAHRSRSVEQPNTWGTWGGAIDSGEDPSVAVKREVKEEAGYTGPLKLIPLFIFSHSSGFKYYNFLALVDKEFTPVLDWETQGSDWFEFGNWPSPLHPGLITLLNDPASAAIIKKYADKEIDEDWKDTLANVGIAGAVGLGGAGGMAIKDRLTSPTGAPTANTAPAAATSQAPTIKPLVAKATAPTKAEPEKKVNKTIKVAPITDSPLEELLMKTAQSSGIVGVELAAFLAQCHHESAEFSRMKEATGKFNPLKYFSKKYDPKFAPHTAKILGNTKVGDGAKYFGRGFIQLTGRDNYRMAQEGLAKRGDQLDLIKHPELAAEPHNAAKIAVWYWQTRVKPYVTNFNDTAAVTRKINSSMRGLVNRKNTFADYKGESDNDV